MLKAKPLAFDGFCTIQRMLLLAAEDDPTEHKKIVRRGDARTVSSFALLHRKASCREQVMCQQGFVSPAWRLLASDLRTCWRPRAAVKNLFSLLSEPTYQLTHTYRRTQHEPRAHLGGVSVWCVFVRARSALHGRTEGSERRVVRWTCCGTLLPAPALCDRILVGLNELCW